MAKIYLRKILAGEMTLEDVPEKWRSEVENLLIAEVSTIDEA